MKHTVSKIRNAEAALAESALYEANVLLKKATNNEALLDLAAFIKEKQWRQARHLIQHERASHDLRAFMDLLDNSVGSLYRATRGNFMRLATSFLPSREDAEDAVQTYFARILEKPDMILRFDPAHGTIETFSRFCFTNFLRDTYKPIRRRAERHISLDADEDLAL